MIHDYRSTDYQPGTRSPWFFSPTMAGGGALMNVGAHLLDRSVWFSARGAFLHRDGRTQTLRQAAPDDVPNAFTHQLAAFVATIEGAPASVSLAHSRHVVELLLAAYRSAQHQGSEVTLPSSVEPDPARGRNGDSGGVRPADA